MFCIGQLFLGEGKLSAVGKEQAALEIVNQPLAFECLNGFVTWPI